MSAYKTPDREDVVAYLVAMIRPLVDMAALARMDETARLLEAAAEIAPDEGRTGAPG
jgi:hypothetical protein